MTDNNRLSTIKQRVAEIKELHKECEYQLGDDILFSLFDNHIDWLLEQAESAVQLKAKRKGL